MNKAIIISAPSGAGKTTIVKNMLKIFPQLSFSISACTRPQRENEENGRDYYFISTEEFKEKIKNGEFIEWEEVYPGKFYGTLKKEVERIWKEGKIIIFDVDVKGAINLKKYFGEKAIAIYIMPPSLEVLENRLRNRNTETDETIKVRIERAKYELSFASEFDYIVINDNLELAIKETKNIISFFINAN
ncbi:MAG: guanylate kinase [Bacteroidales bacterium]|nr:guanylate kinase [Bacteroidales bacterium]